MRRTRSFAAARGATLVTGLLGALLAGPAAAQERARSGLWLDVGGGVGRMRVRCTTCTGVVAAHGATAMMTLGLSVSPKVVLGLEGQLWAGWERGPREHVRSLTVVSQWYPLPGRRFFLRSGTGIAQGPVVPTGTGASPASATGTGVVLTLGVGYDIPLNSHVGLAVQVATHIAALGDLSLPGNVHLDDTIAYMTRLSAALVLR